MRFEVLTQLSPEDVLQRAVEFYEEKTGMDVLERADDHLELAGAIGTAKISAHREYDHTAILAETDRGVGFDVTDVTLRFLYTIPQL